MLSQLLVKLPGGEFWYCGLTTASGSHMSEDAGICELVSSGPRDLAN